MAKVKLVSKLNHPVVVSYEDKGIVLPPYGMIIVDNDQKLGSVPRGVLVIRQGGTTEEPTSDKKKSKGK